MKNITGSKTKAIFADSPEALSDYHRRIEGFLHDLLVIVSQVQDNTLVADRERAEENEGGGVHLRIEDASLTREQRLALEIALRCFREASSRLRADTGHAEVCRLGIKWLADGQITRKEAAGLSESIQSLQTLSRQH